MKMVNLDRRFVQSTIADKLKKGFCAVLDQESSKLPGANTLILKREIADFTDSVTRNLLARLSEPTIRAYEINELKEQAFFELIKKLIGSDEDLKFDDPVIKLMNSTSWLDFVEAFGLDELKYHSQELTLRDLYKDIQSKLNI